MSSADTTSRGATRPHSGQRCTRTARVLRTWQPHRQYWLVPAGFTSNHSPPSSCRFDGELVQEGTPARIMNLLGKDALGHAADAQVFDGDELIAIDDPARELVHEVRPLIGDMLVDVLRFAGELAVRRASSRFGQPPIPLWGLKPTVPRRFLWMDRGGRPGWAAPAAAGT